MCRVALRLIIMSKNRLRQSSYTYLLTYSMVQSPSWEANRFAASQEIPRISRNPKVHYRTRKRPPPVPILGQPIPVHIPTSHLLEIHPNIIHPSTPRPPQWSLSLRLPHPPYMYTSIKLRKKGGPCFGELIVASLYKIRKTVHLFKIL